MLHIQFFFRLSLLADKSAKEQLFDILVCRKNKKKRTFIVDLTLLQLTGRKFNALSKLSPPVQIILSLCKYQSILRKIRSCLLEKKRSRIRFYHDRA